MGLEVEGRKVVAVVLPDIVDHLRFTVSRIKSVCGMYGKTCQKDFLRKDAELEVAVIHRGKTDRKRRCFAIFLHHIPAHLVEELYKGNYFIITNFALLYS